MRLIDSHCHLQADRFDDDVDLVIGAARMAGVERILVPGWNASSSAAALELTDRFDWLDAAVGVHPHDASRVEDDEWEAIVASARDPRVVAIGETGLDYDRVFSPILAQLSNLRRNLALALETGKPAILHCRSAVGEREAQDALLAEILKFGRQPPTIVIHSFSGPLDYAMSMLELGAMISFSGLVFRSTETDSAEVARRTPDDRLLIETDSPFLSAPDAPRGRNEPEWVSFAAEWLADRRDADPELLGEQLVANYDAAFDHVR
ncbi:MAG TPA: TatD family hydrolase [Verrucomicrobiae bacterium]|nr:TatD family hydrolase [Verrucomicrobiae bacterium]